jgi:hypothetical protein
MVERQLPKLHTGVRFPSPARLPMNNDRKIGRIYIRSELSVRTNPPKFTDGRVQVKKGANPDDPTTGYCRWHSHESRHYHHSRNRSRGRKSDDAASPLDKAFKSELRTRTTGRSSCAVHGEPVRRRLARTRRCQRSRLVIHLDQGLNCLRGPLRRPKLRVLSAWIPALWSPLKRVTVLGQPAA